MCMVDTWTRLGGTQLAPADAAQLERDQTTSLRGYQKVTPHGPKESHAGTDHW